MKKVIRIKVNEYTPIRSLLSIAIRDYPDYRDQYLKVMVNDAILLSRNFEYRVHANGRMYKYSSYLSAHNIAVVEHMDPNNLTREDYLCLYEIFKSL